MNLSLGKILVVSGILLAGIQLIPVTMSNPPIEEEISTSPEIKAILKRACYDCHSHETIWPGYSQIAPVSWLLAWDVAEGREELNFSTWNRYDQKKRNKMIREIWEEVEEGEMPPWFYLPPHPEAQLSDQDHAVLRAWASSVPPVSEDEGDE